MRLGLIARADHRGLGQQTHALYRNLQPAKTLVVDCPSMKPLPVQRDWYPDAQWTTNWPPTPRDCADFMRDLDVVLSCETFYAPQLPDIARTMGVKTVLQLNHELLDRRVPAPDLFAAPSPWCWEQIPDPKTLLPVPIELDQFPTERSERRGQLRVVHVVGRPAIHDRNGSDDLFAALRHVKSDVVVTLRCQEPGYLERLVRRHQFPPNVKIVIESGDLTNTADLYRNQDILVLPRRYGGLCLVASEALACSLPVVMPDVSPNNTWLPQEWLVPAQWSTSFMAKVQVDVHKTCPSMLAAKIDEFATDAELLVKGRDQARRLAEGLSWDVWKPKYEALFQSLLV